MFSVNSLAYWVAGSTSHISKVSQIIYVGTTQNGKYEGLKERLSRFIDSYGWNQCQICSKPRALYDVDDVAVAAGVAVVVLQQQQ